MARRITELGCDAAERVSAGCYGALIAATTLIGLADYNLLPLVGLVVITNVIYWATHVFAYTIGDRSDSEASLWSVARHHAWVSAPIVSATFGPLVVVVALELFGVPAKVAIVTGVSLALLGLVVIATTGARLRRLPTLAVVLVGVLTMLLSALLVVVKANLH